jgi:hypothetical protein
MGLLFPLMGDWIAVPRARSSALDHAFDGRFLFGALRYRLEERFDEFLELFWDLTIKTSTTIRHEAE